MHPATTTPPVAIEITSTTTTTSYPNQPNTAATPSSGTTTPSTPRDVSEASSMEPLLHTTPETTTASPRHSQAAITCLRHSPHAPNGTTTSPEAHRTVLFTAAIFFPPLAVYFRRGIGKAFRRNVAFTLLGWIPGVLHALYHVFSKK
ncbi:hypothetical protein N657DRAFT_679384 [Parathielavia appendiculata]|uniref:Plasma membrane proteolipid 3 n=1 Tax=Parathielavia appendiculata TaxID=2587402 RepID=A0AAN6U4Y2_9PEZI|nr:hypothetical protein N657DRAFT_679384 [Parathielavia appendiculata]